MMNNQKNTADTEMLKRYSDAWNEHDIEKIMLYMTEDCIFRTGGGEQSYGTLYQGQAEVRKRFESIWSQFPDVCFKNTRHFLQGDRGCSEWTFRATGPDGNKLEIEGCDIFTFREGKIAVKNTFLKNRK
jgi:ketosteroid isomerase-like protein